MRYQTAAIVILALTCSLLSLPEISYGQNHSVQGTVSDQNEEPLPGVNIQVKGTTRGTSTDADGAYSLTTESASDTLVFSFIGFATQEIPIQGRNEIDVFLTPATLEWGEELVVVGYGTQRQRDLTGSINRISADEVTKQPSLTAMESLQGKVSGVNIINSDAPGGTPTVIMRGLGTALGGRNPLYIVDGNPVDDINNISPNDIENIDFLKDASAASIYGLRAANGVIIITTKSGSEGPAQFSIDTYTGVTTVLNQVEMADAQQYITYFNEENAAEGGYQLSQDQMYDTDWYDELISSGYAINTTAAVSGGSENVNYYLSYNLNNEEGLLDDQNFTRHTLRNNNKFDVFGDFLDIEQNLSIAVTQEEPQGTGVFNTAYRQSPLVPVFYENGRYGQPYVNTTTGEVTYMGAPGDVIGRLNTHGNPFTSIDLGENERQSVFLQGNIAAILNFTDNLTFTSRLGATKFFSKARNFTPDKALYLAADPTRTAEQFEANKAANPQSLEWNDNTLNISKNETLRWNWDNFLNYKNNFSDHNVDVTLGMSSEETGIGQNFSGTAYDVPEQEQYWSLDLANDDYEKRVNQVYYTTNTLLSYFGRVQYNYDQRYYFTGTLRRDGSSKFANNEDYYEIFPSVGLGWTLSNEGFMEDNNIFDFLKLRGSWGKLGNQNVPFNTTQIFTSTGSANQNYVFGSDQTLRFGASVGSPARDISWEIVEEWNFGVDTEFLDSRLSFTADAYQKTTENLILNVSPLPNSPFSGNFFDVAGEVVNKGLELALNWQEQVNDDFTYSIGANFSYNTNEVTDIVPGYDGQTGANISSDDPAKRLKDGEPLGSWWLYDAIGVWQDSTEIANNPSLGGAEPGHLRYADTNEDGVIDERDKRYYGSYIPKYNYGIDLAANYKAFDFSVDAFGVGGNKVYNGIKNTRLGGENVTEEMFEDRWTSPGSTNSNPGANRDELTSNYYLESGAYFRINNITLGYTFDDIAQHLNSVRLYVSAQNPFLFTGYSGFTPELIGNGDPYGTAGVEISAYPNTRQILFGINIDLQ